MDSDAHRSGPAAQLLATAGEVTPGWLRRITVEAARSGGCLAEASVLDAMVESESERVLSALAELLAQDVDRQRTNPLSLFRDAVAAPTALLRSIGAPPPLADSFTSERFPEDVYQLGPAAWSDIDPRLREPGLAWGAWKAMTVLRRRHEEGLR